MPIEYFIIIALVVLAIVTPIGASRLGSYAIMREGSELIAIGLFVIAVMGGSLVMMGSLILSGFLATGLIVI